MAIIHQIRDLINTPAEDMMPPQLAQAVRDIGGQVQRVIGDELLTQGYHAVHAVGRASVHQPRFIELTWWKCAASRACLIGKGVCFDTGG